MTSSNGIRVAVGEPNGRRSSTWRIWFGPNDVYAAFRQVANKRKVSIHFEHADHPGRVRYAGFTDPYAKYLMPDEPMTRQKRMHAEWPGADLGSDCYAEFRFRIPECELRHLDSDGARDVIWLDAPPVGMGTEVLILSGPPSYQGLFPQRSYGAPTGCLHETQLANGRRIWVVHHVIPAPSSEIEKYRKQVWREFAIHGWLDPAVPPPSKDERLNLSMDCQDGSGAEVELAADFIGLRRRALQAVAPQA
jgi:hypothetical protein